MKYNLQQLLVVPEFKKFIIASSTGRRVMPSGKKVRAGTIKQYQCVLLLLEEFEQYQNSPLRIHLLQRASIRLLQKEKKYLARFFRHFSLFLYKKKNCFDQYVGSVYKVIKTFFHFLAIEWKYQTPSPHLTGKNRPSKDFIEKQCKRGFHTYLYGG